MQAVKEFYSCMSHAREDTEMNLGFEGELITLSIPEMGVTLESGWEIFPLYVPTVSHKT